MAIFTVQYQQRNSSRHPPIPKREAHSGSPQIFRATLSDCKYSVIVLEWQLWSGAGGMAAQMGHARVQGQLNHIAKQHKWQLTLHKGPDRFTLRTELTEQQYTLLCLQWQIKYGYEQWRVIERCSSSKDIQANT